MSYKWKPLVRAHAPVSNEPPEVIKQVAAMNGISEAEAMAALDRHHAQHQTEYWINDLYQVEKSHYPGNVVQLNIRRRDGAAHVRDWRHFQRIKNQLVGPECEGIELYPAESRKVDTSNKWHIWCINDPTFRFPVGFAERDVIAHEVTGHPGLRQRADDD